MLTLRPEPGADPDRPLRILGLAAHPDDLEIGCAGALLRWQRPGGFASGPWTCQVVVATGTDERVAEARAACAELLGDRLAGPLVALGLTDGFLPAQWEEVKRRLAAAIDGPPDLVLTPGRSDAHQDHRLLGELAWQLCRQSTIWEYEIPKWDGDLGQPNLYVPLDEEVMSAKVALLHRHYASQRTKPWYDAEVFRGLARLRGVECAAPYAEAFTARKIVVG
jgi:LmbE family N-acetylglucosaminyl deacetylase